MTAREREKMQEMTKESFKLLEKIGILFGK